MKNLLLITLLLVSTLMTGQNLFKKVDLADEFGDKIGQVQRNISYGTFSNSVTNNSKIMVKTIYSPIPPNYTIEDYKENTIKVIKDESVKDYFLKNYEKSWENIKNVNGTISFDILEYENIKVNMIGIKTGTISIKTEDGVKVYSKLTQHNFSGNRLIIIGYKEQIESVKDQVKYGIYDWNETEIYNYILNTKEKIQIVISFGNSSYNFILENN